MSLKPVPMHNYVLVEMDKGEFSDREGGLVVAPDREVLVVGTVVSKGPDVRLSIQDGSHVLLPPYGAGQKVRYALHDYVLLLDHEILGVFEP